MSIVRLIIPLFILCVCTASAQQGLEWRYMNSKITAFGQKPGNPDVVFVGDAAGLIRRSDDRGATWRMVSFQSEMAISDIAFLDADRGFAATDQSGLILMTTDGGNTWRRKQFKDPANPDDGYRFQTIARIVIVDDKTVFFDIFSHPISGASLREAIVTRDGGATFRIDSVPGEVYHVANGTMIALGREPGPFGLAKFAVSKSIDRGLSWSIVQVEPAGLNNDFNFHGIEHAFFISPDEFFITANKRLASDKAIYKTTDGGKTFAPLANFPGAKVDYLYFKNSSEGIAITGNSGGKTTFFTSDGGNSWTASERNMESEALYLGNNTLIAYSNDHTAISTDFGRTWTEQSEPINSIRNSTGTPGLHFLQSIDDTTAVASVGTLSSGVYSGQELMMTTNGGLTWKAVKDGAGNILKGQAFHFIDKNKFFFIGSGFQDGGTMGGYMKIKYTTDGGLTSKEVYTGEYTENVATIDFADANNAFTYSLNASTINYSTDGGQSWTQVLTAGKLGQVEKIVFPSIDSWYAINSSKNVLRSTDRGATWSDITPPMASCGTIYFTDATTGYMHGCQEKFYKTTDGGQHWTDISSGLDSKITNGQFSAIAFRNSTEGYMADRRTGSAYTFASTADGGNTWQWDVTSQIRVQVVKISFANENVGMLMDAHGNVARYIGPAEYPTDTVLVGTGVTDVRELQADDRISVYPNPASDMIVVDAHGSEVLAVEITDIMGRVHFSANASAHSSVRNIATTELPIGVYVVRISTDRGVFSQRLLIVR